MKYLYIIILYFLPISIFAQNHDGPNNNINQQNQSTGNSPGDAQKSSFYVYSSEQFGEIISTNGNLQVFSFQKNENKKLSFGYRVLDKEEKRNLLANDTVFQNSLKKGMQKYC